MSRLEALLSRIHHLLLPLTNNVRQKVIIVMWFQILFRFVSVWIVWMPILYSQQALYNIHRLETAQSQCTIYTVVNILWDILYGIRYVIAATTLICLMVTLWHSKSSLSYYMARWRPIDLGFQWIIIVLNPFRVIRDYCRLKYHVICCMQNMSYFTNM